MNHSHRIRLATQVALFGVVTGILWAAGSVSPVRACNTPVYRYAMYNWPPAPYYVFYFHHEQVAKEDEAVNKVLDELSRADPPANVLFATVDVSNEEEFKKFPKVVKRTYQSHAEGKKPLHLVFCPWVLYYAWMFEQYARVSDQQNEERQTPEESQPGASEQTAGPADEKQDQPEESQPETPKQTSGPPGEDHDQAEEGPPPFTELFAGRLDKKTVEAMVDSPVRKQLGQLLRDGNAAVLLILTGPDQDANRQAEKVAGEVVAMADRDEFLVSGGDDFAPDQFLPEAPGNTPPQDPRQDDSSHTLKLAVLKLARTDPAEKWLVDSLLSIEPDLRQSKYAKSPMVFAVYGRGRAMPPYLDKGITAENLAECVTFLTGPCSCMVKEQNPGVDLLVRRDWDAVAEALAANDPAFTGGPWGYQEFAPDESGDWTRAAAADTPPDEPPPNGDLEPKHAQPPVAQKTSPRTDAQSLQAQPSAAGEAPTGGASDAFALKQAWKIGIWIGLGTALVLIAGFVLILRQRPT